MFEKEKEEPWYINSEGFQFIDPETNKFVEGFTPEQQRALVWAIGNGYSVRRAAFKKIPAVLMPSVAMFLDTPLAQKLDHPGRSMYKGLMKQDAYSEEIVKWLLSLPDDKKAKADWIVLSEDSPEAGYDYLHSIHACFNNMGIIRKKLVSPEDCGAVVFAYLARAKDWGSRKFDPILKEANRWYRKHGVYDIPPKEKTVLESMCYSAGDYMTPASIAPGLNEQIDRKKIYIAAGEVPLPYIPIPHANDGQK